jgi:hypothetical protein
MEMTFPSETAVDFQRTTRNCITALQNDCSEILEFYVLI